MNVSLAAHLSKVNQPVPQKNLLQYPVWGIQSQREVLIIPILAPFGIPPTPITSWREILP